MNFDHYVAGREGYCRWRAFQTDVTLLCHWGGAGIVLHRTPLTRFSLDGPVNRETLPLNWEIAL